MKVAEEHGIALRQNYNRTAPRLAAQIGRYAHAKQFKRMRKAVRTLRTRVSRVQRKVARQLAALPEQAQAKVNDLLARTGRILAQRTKDKSKLYTLHAPEVECISKGKRRVRSSATKPCWTSSLPRRKLVRLFYPSAPEHSSFTPPGSYPGKKAPTRWRSLERLRALGDVEVVEERYAEDGGVWSSAGISAGIDLMLAFIASVDGDDAAGKVQFSAEFYLSAVRYGMYETHTQAPAYLKPLA